VASASVLRPGGGHGGNATGCFGWEKLDFEADLPSGKLT